MNPSERPLRILCVVNLPWDARLGATRVWMELAEQWRAAGHTVDHYTLTEAFSKPTTRNVILSLRQVRFPNRAGRFVRKNAARYDVVDSLLGTVPFSKESLHFHGLLVARSVGFYWLYEKFDRHARTRWPDLSRGKFTGRIFYNLIRRRLLQSANRAIAHADLLNLPNEDELKSLRQDLRSTKAVIVQPYGLTEKRRRQLAETAHSPEAKLRAPRICFLGMWSVRKGARDLGEIVRRIRVAFPAVRLRFLGTFTDDSKVLRDLGIDRCDWVEIIDEYEPANLPELLKNCTAGIFPSYVEGFGLGLLEQLAAGIPTVAYDAPGPRQILAPAREELLVPAGDVAAMSARIIDILHLSLPDFIALQKKSSAIAAQYSWPEIASHTIDAYRARLRQNGAPIVFAQPFGWRSPGGGARIMRALLRDPPQRIEFICTSPSRPPQQMENPEIHLQLRPYFGRFERSRFAGIAHATAPFFAKRFIRRLEERCRHACAVHAVAHGGLDFSHAFDVAEKLALPFFLQVHDDFLYTAHTGRAKAAVSRAWSGAAARFIISDQLGQEYQRRYGAADYIVITDGLEHIAPAPRPRLGEKLRVYFMGLFHLEYEPNLRAVAAAFGALRQESFAITMSMRCGGVRASILQEANFIRVLPFADEAEIECDLAEADLLYLPLPFDAAHAAFVRYSLSTKLVTYLGSGIPIFYHGPADSTVGELLAQHNAAIACYSLEPEELIGALRRLINEPAAGEEVAARALTLARERFFLPEIRERFWSTIRSFTP